LPEGPSCSCRPGQKRRTQARDHPQQAGRVVIGGGSTSIGQALRTRAAVTRRLIDGLLSGATIVAPSVPKSAQTATHEQGPKRGRHPLSAELKASGQPAQYLSNKTKIARHHPHWRGVTPLESKNGPGGCIEKFWALRAIDRRALKKIHTFFADKKTQLRICLVGQKSDPRTCANPIGSCPA
jgi:hypothetical protein